MAYFAADGSGLGGAGPAKGGGRKAYEALQSVAAPDGLMELGAFAIAIYVMVLAAMLIIVALVMTRDF